MVYGYIEKDWGINFPKSYLWCQANNFKKRNTSIFLSIADIPFKKISFKGLICILLVDGEEYRFATYNFAKVKNIQINKRLNIINILIKKNIYKLHVNIKTGNDKKIIAPNSSGMERAINESLDSEITVTLLKGNKVLFKGFSLNAGLEIVE